MKRIFVFLTIVGVALFPVSGALHADSEILRVGDFGIGKQVGVIPRLALFEDSEIIVKLKGDQKFQRIKLPLGDRVEAALGRYRARPDVLYAEPNYIAHALFVPNDPYYLYQWHLDNPTGSGVEAEQAWNVSSGTGVVVAVVDTGVAYEDYTQSLLKKYYRAPDLAGTSFVPGYDFVTDDTHPNDENGHGTHVTGTIAQSTHNGLGVSGLAYGASVMPVRVLDKYGSGTYADVAEGIRWAADRGANVINLSLGGPSPATYLEEALSYAYNKGVTIVAAAGNDGTSSLSYPAAYNSYVIAVGATRYDKALAGYSNYGQGLDLVAPGGDVNVDQNGDGYGDGVLQQTFGNYQTSNFGYYFFQGTSMAAPHAAAAAALVIAHGNATTPQDVRTALESTAKDLGVSGWDAPTGFGLVDASAALSWSSGPPDEVNDPPVAKAGPDQTVTDTDGNGTEAVTLDGLQSFDPDGTIVSYQWNFGDGATSTGAVVSHAYAVGTWTAKLTVTDNGGLTHQDTAVITVNTASSVIEVFSDSFEVSEWNGLWTEDSQNDWFRSTQRATNGNFSAEVDGLASDASLISQSIGLSGKTNATITFSWYIESGLDAGEYLAFDVSGNGGSSWTEKARLKGDVDPENTWHNVSMDVTGASALKLRFRGKMSLSSEDANLDRVRVVAW